MNMPLQGSGQRPVTTPGLRSQTQAATGPLGAGPAADVGQTAQTGPAGQTGQTAQTVQTQSYDQAPFDPSSVQIPDTTTLSEPQRALAANVGALLQPAGEMPASRRSQLEGLARTLGFRNLDMLQHHLRFLSPAQKTTLMTNLCQQLAGSQNSDDTVKQVFKNAFKAAISDLFVNNPRFPGQQFPMPQFKSEHPQGEASWDTAALASVYNGLSQILQDTPDRFPVIARGGPPQADGSPGPMQFVRRQSPTVNPNSNIFEQMSQATMIAHTDCDNCHVFLYDTAIRGDNGPIVGQVVGKLDLLSRVDNATQQLVPVYREGELNERGLRKQNGESDAAYNTRIRNKVSTEFLQKYGGNDPQRLTEAINFVIRYRALNDPAVVNPPILEVPSNASANDPRVQEALRRMGPNKMQMVVARMEQVDAVAQMQGFLRATLPGGAEISVDGLLGPQTKTMVHAFQASVAMNTIKERIEDDPNLSEQRKNTLLTELNQQFQQLGAHPDQAAQILGRVRAQLNTLINESPSPLAAHTRQALVVDFTKISELAKTPTFNHQTAEYLVNNWLNVMDSGQGLDMAEQLVVHEAGHIWEHQLDQNGGDRVYENWTRLCETPETSPSGGTGMYQTNTQDYHDQLHSDRSASSDYGSTSPREDFAEASRIFTYDPQRLMRRSLMKFLYINALSGSPHDTNKVLSMARECGYSDQDIRDRISAFQGQGSNSIRFTMEMSHRLAEAYAPLLHELAHQQALNNSPVAPGLQFQLSDGMRPQTGPRLNLDPLTLENQPRPMVSSLPTLPQVPDLQLTVPNLAVRPPVDSSMGATSRMALLFQPRLAGASLQPAPALPNQAGWVFERLSNRYRELNEQLQRTDLSTNQRDQIRSRMDSLLNDFISDGPEGSDGAASFKSALAAPGLNYDSEQGRALVAALAIYRATGAFDRSQHQALAAKLPPAFDQMLQESAFQTVMQPGAPYDSTLQLLGSLERVRWYEQTQISVDGQLSDANVTLSDLSTDLGALCLADGPPTIMRTGPAVTRSVATLMNDPQVKEKFAQNEFALMLALDGVNKAVSALNRASGRQYPPLSLDNLKQLMVVLNAGGSQPITPQNLGTFLQQRAQGFYPATDSGVLFSQR